MSWDEQARDEQAPPNFAGEPPFQPLPQPQSPPDPQPLGQWADPVGAAGPQDQTAAFGMAPTMQQPHYQTDPMVQPYPGFNGPPPPAPKKRTGLIVGVAVAVVLVGGGAGAYAAFGGSNSAKNSQNTAAGGPQSTVTAGGGATTAAASPTETAASADATTAAATASVTIALPTKVDGLSQLDGSTADAMKASTKSTLAGSPLLNGSQIGVYATSGSSTPLLIVVAEPAAALGSDLQSTLQSVSPALLLPTMVTAAGLTNSVQETSSDPNAALGCGGIQSTNGNSEGCVWVDKAGLGIVIFTHAVDNTAAGAYSDALRAASETGG